MGRFGEWMDKAQRMQLKAWICILGIVLLVVVFVAGLLLALIGKEPEHVPVVRKLVNVWVMEVEETNIRVFEEGQERTYGFGEGVMVPLDCREQVADVTLVDEMVSQIVCKTHKINGKVLAVDERGVELLGFGYLPFAQERKGYRLYDKLSMCEPEDVMVGYDFTDFVMENGEICGILMVKEAAMEYIRVLVSTGNYEALLHDNVVFTCDTDFTVEYGSYGARVEELYQAFEVCSIEADSVMFQAKESLEEGLQEDGGDLSQIGRVCIKPSALTGKVILQNVNRNQGIPAYRGTIELLKTPDGLAVINEVLLEEYLYSVVPSEMPASYPGEALRAQAICARTYAYKHMIHAGLAEYGAHVDDSTGYQVYNNIEEQEATTTAVKETFGQILLAEEESMPADTYYYSTSCGIGSNADVWNLESGDSPVYLSPRPISRALETESGDQMQEQMDGLFQAKALMDENNFAKFIHAKNTEDYEASEPWYRWTYTVTQIDHETIRERLKQRYEADPKRVLTRNKKGEYKSSPIGEWERIKSIDIVSRGLGGVAREMILETDKGIYKVLTEYNIRYVLCDTESPVCRQDGSQAKVASLLPSGYFVVETVNEGDFVTGYVLHGGGYGHGVGMSQNGARNMALEGRLAETILTFFYQGCQIANIYEW